MARYNLLSINAKLAKSVSKYDIISAGLSLAPARRAGYENVCPEAGFCAKLCLGWFSGRLVMPIVRDAMIKRTALYFDDRPEFMRLLRSDLNKITEQSLAEDRRAYVRLNVTSDLDWSGIVTEYPLIQFYDYCKVRSRLDSAVRGEWPTNYALTPSYSERLTWPRAQRWIDAGLNLAVCFSTYYRPQIGRVDRLPRTWHGLTVVDGDTHDLRLPEYDGSGNIVGLRYKGPAALLSEGIKRGFVIDAG